MATLKTRVAMERLRDLKEKGAGGEPAPSDLWGQSTTGWVGRFRHSRPAPAVARVGNFTKAAQACNVSQPSLTRGIGKLESELGGLVFERNSRGSELTDLGRLM